MGDVTFRGGMPYAPDVARLSEQFPVSGLKEGMVLDHASLEKVVQSTRGTSRYYGVVNAWINQNRNKFGIVMVWEATAGVKVLSPAEVLDNAETWTRRKIKQTRRAVSRFGWVDRARLDDTGQKRLDHDLRIGNAITESLSAAKRQLAVDLAPVQSLPKRQIPGA